ncbi:transcriptional repressor LexA [Natranaerobius trueperi]|uniref:LexA repressor n=1 Tax=Natranaerobius trueperi TaxID=759412 RepID=A0A226BV52_9FIRM|nr:transcriptional repressor LexA [Natranaerobius trueperi]OWZ82855.1 repressor LexA [Natranaerobius trueperi]
MRKSKKPMKIYNFIKDYIKNKGYPPTVREICKGVGLSSTSTVHLHLSTLEKEGYIRRDSTRPRTIEVLNNSEINHENNNVFGRNNEEETIHAPVVGQVTAGKPILAEENVVDHFPIPKHLGRGKDVFMLQIVGDSMMEAGIYDSDFVIVNRQSTANNGEIVVALLDNEATVKRFYKEKNNVRLQPENEAYSPILTRDVQILGKVIGLFRNIE